MTDKNKQDEGKGGVNPVTAIITGVVIGAGVAVIGTIALKDKKNREKVKEALSSVKDKAVCYMEDMQKQAQDKKDEMEKELADGNEKVKTVKSSAKHPLHHGQAL